jgi:hypothetical protein
MIKYILVILFLAASVTISAQSASQLFENAKQSYENSQYSQAVSYLDQCQKALGAPSPRIESLRTLVYYGDDQWEKAYLSINKYFQMANGRYSNTTAHKELVQLKSTIQSRLENKDAAYKDEIDRKRMQEADKEINELESISQKRSEAQKKESERSLFNLYSKTENEAELRQYVTIFGESELGKKIKQKADYIDYVNSGDQSFRKEQFANAVSNFKKAYNIFKSDSVYQRILLATEELDYQTAVKSTELADYEAYYVKYPKGTYIQTVSNSLVKYHLKQVETSTKQKYFSSISGQLSAAAEYIQKASPIYRSNYYKAQLDAAKAMESNGNMIKQQRSYFSQVQTYYKSYYDYSGAKDPAMKKHMDKLSRQNRRIFGYGDNYAAFSIRADQEAFAGFDIVSLNHRTLGFMLSARANPHMFENDADGEGSVYDAGKTRAKYITAYGNVALTYKVIHPVWIYAGGGVASYAKVEDRPGDENDSKMVTTKNLAMPNAEGGIFIALKPVVLSFGVSMPIFSNEQKVLLNIREPLFVPNASIGIVF